MRIEIDTVNCGEEEYTAAIALLASLGGRLPSHGIGEVHVVPHPHGAPGTLTRAEPTAHDVAEALLNSEAARVDAAAPPPPPADGAVVLDADGIPWDARIHAGTKSQTKGKTWTKLRGVDEVLYGRVHGELQEQYADQFAAGNLGTGTGATGEASPATGIAGDPPAPNPPSSTQDAPAPPPPSSGNDAAGNAPTGQETAENAATAGARFPDFPAFVQAVNAIRVPSIPYLELNTFAQTLGVTGGFKDMKDHAELWETFYGLAGGQ